MKYSILLILVLFAFTTIKSQTDENFIVVYSGSYIQHQKIYDTNTCDGKKIASVYPNSIVQLSDIKKDGCYPLKIIFQDTLIGYVKDDFFMGSSRREEIKKHFESRHILEEKIKIESSKNKIVYKKEDFLYKVSFNLFSKSIKFAEIIRSVSKSEPKPGGYTTDGTLLSLVVLPKYNNSKVGYTSAMIKFSDNSVVEIKPWNEVKKLDNGDYKIVYTLIRFENEDLLKFQKLNIKKIRLLNEDISYYDVDINNYDQLLLREKLNFIKKETWNSIRDKCENRNKLLEGF